MPDASMVRTVFAGVRSSPVRDLLALLSDPTVISFAGGIPDPALFDVEALADCYARVLAGRGRSALQYSSTEGEPGLRQIAAQSFRDQGLDTTVDDVLVTTGSQQGISLVAQAMLEPGDVVLVERPTYLAALQAFQLSGARLVELGGDDQGPDPDALASAIAEHRPKLVYLVPTFQNPTGRTIHASRRRQLADVLMGERVLLVEDDPYAGLWFGAPPPAPIGTAPGMAQRTVLLRSLSKVVAPGMRIGWLHAPSWLRPALVVAKQAMELHTSTVEQLVAEEYLAAAGLDAHLDLVRRAYRQRCDAMIAALGEALPAGSRWTRPDGGMFVWAQLPDDVDTRLLLERSLSAGVAFVPGWAFYASGPPPSAMRLSFATNPTDRITEGVRRLASALP